MNILGQIFKISTIAESLVILLPVALFTTVHCHFHIRRIELGFYFMPAPIIHLNVTPQLSHSVALQKTKTYIFRNQNIRGIDKLFLRSVLKHIEESLFCVTAKFRRSTINLIL